MLIGENKLTSVYQKKYVINPSNQNIKTADKETSNITKKITPIPTHAKKLFEIPNKNSEIIIARVLTLSIFNHPN